MKQATVGLNLRKATLDDGPFLLALRNSDDVRSQSKVQEVIPEDIHTKWLQRCLNSSDTVIWIIEEEGKRLGYIRAQKINGGCDKGDWLLSIALECSACGKGYASWALGEACRLMRADPGTLDLVAEVLETNVRAHRLFKKLGFIEVLQPDNKSGLIRYQLHGS